MNTMTIISSDNVAVAADAVFVCYPPLFLVITLEERYPQHSSTSQMSAFL
jgi:hypothetical protein